MHYANNIRVLGSVLAVAVLAGCEGGVSLGTEGPRGPAGEVGAVGARGPRGVPGSSSPRELAQVSAWNDTPGAGQLVEVQAHCPAGSRLLTGGCTWGKYPGDVMAWRSVGSTWDDAPEIQDSWHCGGVSEVDGAGVEAYVFCEIIDEEELEE